MESALAGVAEGRMAEVVRETGGLHEVSVDVKVVGEVFGALLEPLTNGAPDLGDLERMGEARAIEIVFPREEDLGLALQAPEG